MGRPIVLGPPVWPHIYDSRAYIAPKKGYNLSHLSVYAATDSLSLHGMWPSKHTFHTYL